MTDETVISLPLSGRLLIAHLVAYGLALNLTDAGATMWIEHRHDSLECEPVLTTSFSLAEVGEAVRRGARDCEAMVEADLVAGATGNDRRSVIWARNTNAQRAWTTLESREYVFDAVATGGNHLATALLAGLGAPSPWLDEKPHRGASALDGVPGNHTSDLVRGVLRKVRPVAAAVGDAELSAMWTAGSASVAGDEDKTGWAPRGVRIHPVHQWLAALGLGMLPVGLAAHGRAATPCVAISGGRRSVRVPILESSISVPRLRALLQRRELAVRELDVAGAARLRSLGVREVVDFDWLDRSTASSVAFSFRRGTLVEL